MKGAVEERAVELGEYIIENNATVRAAAKKFQISKSTVHTDVTNWNGRSKRKQGWHTSLFPFSFSISHRERFCNGLYPYG